ncbi:hypothetical protein F53441_8393 [Fusarium austroafricanum]|uniref:C2H2-domain containing protein second zinc finger domain-containing protein n=1 Tax=Fusarium austroafricanum TaxID=2364996 RepID=A0A8H4NWK9_9HYPO|nr:hypothetical protein F53441_8393 [Fusarium austroafricanum]
MPNDPQVAGDAEGKLQASPVSQPRILQKRKSPLLSLRDARNHYTISQDHTSGEEAHRCQLLANFGRKRLLYGSSLRQHRLLQQQAGQDRKDEDSPGSMQGFENNHEREAQEPYRHDDKPFLCVYDGCGRSLPGNGFPHQRDVRDHMKHVHNDHGSSSGSPTGETAKGQNDATMRPHSISGRVKRSRTLMDEEGEEEEHGSDTTGFERVYKISRGGRQSKTHSSMETFPGSRDSEKRPLANTFPLTDLPASDRVQELAQVMYNATAEKQKAMTRSQVYQRITSAQISELESRGKDVLMWFYENQAFQVLKANAEELKLTT